MGIFVESCQVFEKGATEPTEEIKKTKRLRTWVQKQLDVSSDT